MAEENKYNNYQEEEELEIDLMEYARKLWASRNCGSCYCIGNP